MKEVTLSPAAAGELEEAVAWYNAKTPNRGDELFQDVRRAFLLIAEHPRAWRTAGSGLRRYTMDRFPYLLIYAEEEAEIVVYVLAHTSRDPNDWRKRATDEKQQRS